MKLTKSKEKKRKKDIHFLVEKADKMTFNLDLLKWCELSYGTIH